MMLFRNKNGSEIGAIILFVGMILISAIAAGLLIQTSFDLPSKALATGMKNPLDTSTKIVISSLFGDISNGEISYLDLNIKLAPGSPDLDLSSLKIQLNLDNIEKVYSATDLSWSYGLAREVIEGTLSDENMLKIGINPPREIRADEDYQLIITAPNGISSKLSSVTPDFFDSNRIILYP